MNDALTRSLLETLDTLSDGLTSGRLAPVDWHNQVARELFVHHLAAYADGSGKDERAVLAAVKKIVGSQIDYLNGFTDDIEAGRYDDRPAALKARSDLYAGALRGSYYGGRYPGLRAHPGDGSTPCKGNCKCTLEERDDGIYWVLHPAEHCAGCLSNAADSPYAREA